MYVGNVVGLRLAVAGLNTLAREQCLFVIDLLRILYSVNQGMSGPDPV